MTLPSHFHIARFVLQTETALSISTGSPDGVFDTALVHDANGLPAIPGSSLAGVLRHLYWNDHGEAAMRDLFGFQDPAKDHASGGRPSGLRVEWGCIHDQYDRPVQGLVLPDAERRLAEDPILAPLVAWPTIRQRVRIGHRGCAADKAKFDRAVLPAGYRFSCELSLLGSERDDPRWTRLLALLHDPRLRLGGAVRAGLGALRLIRLATGRFDLTDSDQAKAFRALGQDIGDLRQLQDRSATAAADADCQAPAGWLCTQLDLDPEDLWRVGQGHSPLGDYTTAKSAPDALPLMEQALDWQPASADTATPLAEPRVRLALLPGASVKGAIAHRTRFYLNCLTGSFADLDDDKDAKAARAEAIHGMIFGSARDNADDATDHRGQRRRRPSGRSGRLFIDDARIEVKPDQVSSLNHNAIDRFTGGVRDRLLFSEELLGSTRIRLRLLLRIGPEPIDDPDAERRADKQRQAAEQLRLGLKALHRALLDLAEGRLPLGAGTGKGHGAMRASLPEDWTRSLLAEPAATAASEPNPATKEAA